MSSIVTPQWSFSLLKEKDVYEPAEDSFLLLDAIEQDLKQLTSTKPNIILEIGSGSGVIITALASVFKTDAFCLAVDINIDACTVTKNTAQLNNVQVDVINANLLDGVHLREAIDVIVFNPPYVATESEETLVEGIAQAWAGGENGREILDRLLPSISKAISNTGVLYLVAISYNDVENLIVQMKPYDLKGEIIMRRQIQGELLFILKFSKMK
ncbi:methyltransferase N6AMT1 isoform X2 [Planococcus citri]|uniref:methyltransferase N6AMT1 isoform X2 n=1 Tax=Planococcus citri TaxID=170843 RepID=UPI0031F9FD99